MDEGEQDGKPAGVTGTDQQSDLLANGVLDGADILSNLGCQSTHIDRVEVGYFLLQQGLVVHLLQTHALSRPRVTPAVQGNEG